MTNPVIMQMLSKVENQNRARVRAHIQQINQAEKTRSKTPSLVSVIILRISKFAQRFSTINAAIRAKRFSPLGHKK